MPGEEDITCKLPVVDVEEADAADFIIQHAVRTDTGLVRDHNEDDFLVVANEGIYLVADGMGGHKAGAVASQICIDTVEAYFAELRRQRDVLADEPEKLANEHPVPEADFPASLMAANKAIYDASASNTALAGMGTTAVGVRIRGNEMTICHAGDSRAYLFRHGDLRQLTTDHSLSNFLRALGRDGEARLAEETMSNVIMRALGLEPTVEIERSAMLIEPGDRFLLCSDGLSDLVAPDAISRILLDPDLKRWQTVEMLVEHALDGGGHDNITAMIVDVYAKGMEPLDDDPAHESGKEDVRPDHLS